MVCQKKLVSLVVLLGVLPTAARAQAPNPPLNFGNNFFVTGDYIVAGANGMASTSQTINGVTYAVGTITVPDANPGITGAKQVPKGAQIVAALLYWQTVEKVGVAPGAPGSGQNGYFRPLLYSKNGGPAAPGYAISGSNVSGASTVSWSSGGCSGGSTGKTLRTYRADVGGALPLDAAGNPTANGSFEVRIPSVGNSTPLTLGATLIVIYRIPVGTGGPQVPLNSIVIYDGDYSQSGSQLTMTQQLQGFYDADHNTISRLTHIVGGGQSNKDQTVYLGSGANNPVALPFLYGNKLPAFPGWYGMWDNPTWTFNSQSQNPANPILEDSSSATTRVVPSMSNQGCVSWGAVILSTTVKNSDHDGILDSWKTHQGYCDASSSTCQGPGDPAWVDLTGAAIGQRDIFLQYDYMCSSISNGMCAAGGANYSFDPRLAVDAVTQKTAVDKVVDAFNNHTGSVEPLELHAVAGNAIAEAQSAVSCTDTSPTPTCPFAKAPGTIGFREGLTYIKNQNIDPNTGLLCTPGTQGCGAVPVFQHGKKDSYHYTLFSHGVGLPNWYLSDGSLTGVTQSGNTVTFTTSSPHGIAAIPGDFCQFGRVTVVYAITNPNLEGTYCVLQKNLTSTTFAITVGGSSTNFSYTSKTDPNLSVANGQVTSMSGFSDVGGQNSVISLGYGAWGPPNNPASDGHKWQVKAGTFMHELGHTLGLTHGGTFYPNLANNDFTPSFEANCKPNVQSIMSYSFQVDLLELPGQPNSQVVDYSEEPLTTLTESSPQAPGFLNNTFYDKTAWYQLTSYAGGTSQQTHCDGTARNQNDPSTSYVSDFVTNFGWSKTNPPGITGSDLNFSGTTTDVMHGHDEWDGTVLTGVSPSPGVDLQQVSAVGTISTVGLGGEAGALKPAGGGGALKPAGGGGALKPAGGGGALKPAGGGGLRSDISHETANSYARPPRGLTITQEEVSPRLIDLGWTIPTFGTPVNYNIYRSTAGGAFALIGSVPGSQTTFQDTVACNTAGYRYRVTNVTTSDTGQQLESTPSNTVPASGEPLLTGCYTAPVNVAVQASGVQGDIVPVTWTLTDDFYAAPPAPWSSATAGNPVTNLAANTLVAVGPDPTRSCALGGRTTLLRNGQGQLVSTNPAGTFANSGNQFTFTLDTDVLCAGSYTFELDLDSGQKFTSSALQLSIDINDQDTPRITTLALPSGTVGLAYGTTLTEDGGTAPVTWTVTGLPTGISQQAVGSPNISGTTCVAAGSYAVGATVLDSASPKNSGSQAFTLQVNKANTTTAVSSDANPSFFQQLVTFTVTVAPQYSCTPTGTVTLYDGGVPIALASNLPLSGGKATFATFALSVGVHSITASYSGDNSFNSSNSGIWLQTVNKANTSLSLNSVSPSPAFVGQPITISYTFGVVAPGAGSPIAPTGPITITAKVGATVDSSCVVITPTPGGGMCTLTPTPTTAGPRTFTISYSGDGNFLASGANGNYDVYQLVFTTQPTNTGVGLTMTPAVVVTAEDSSNNTLTTFTGGITLAIGAGPGTLSGTLSQSAVAGAATFNDLSINQVANGYTLNASPAGGLASVTSNAFNIDTFYVDNQGNFGTLDLATGTVTQIGAATVPGSTGIDLTPGLQVYAYNASNQLMQITPSTGAATPVGSLGSIPQPATTGSLTDASYFGIDAATGDLYSIDRATGATTLVGPTSAAALPSGCTLESSLTGSANVLYYTIGYSGASCSSPLPDTLYQIDPTNGTTTTIGQVTISGSGVNAFVGSAFVGGKLYGFTADGKEYSINPASGVATFLSNTTISGTNTSVAILAAGASQ